MRISVITVCRNAGGLLEHAVASVLGQSHPPEDYVIQDGASTDGSLERLVVGLGKRDDAQPATALKGLCEGAWNLRVGPVSLRILSERDDGIYDALNRAISRSTGDVVAILHADDQLADAGVLKRVMQAFEGGAEVVYGDLQYIREKADGRLSVFRHWRSGVYHPHKLRWGWMPPHPALYLRRDVYERAALGAGVYFDPAFRCAGDYDWMLRVLPRLETAPVYIPDVLVRMRVGGVSNRSMRHLLLKSREDWQAIRRNRGGGLHTLVGKQLRKAGQFRVFS